ncbi:MAG TPA: orotidine-5'-phosphate decarboxylase, partial [Pyrinomonadaceae bacterium]
IGKRLFVHAGPDVVRAIRKLGAEIFLDLKFHDIPHQVTGSVRAATELGASMLTIHAAGGPEMMRRAAETAKEVAEREQIPSPSIVAVTVLTSLDSKALNQIGFAEEPTAIVKRLALLASASGVDGVVASPQEITPIRSTVPEPSFLVVTPGIRPAQSLSDDDQKRIATPAFALAAGASYIVVGRPITAAPDPTKAANNIIREMEVKVATMYGTAERL